MKTNILWRCQYCDKILGRKRTVLMHISNIHKADGENPVMYSPMTVSPKDVDSLLRPKTVKSESKVKVNGVSTSQTSELLQNEELQQTHIPEPEQTPEPQQNPKPQQTPEPQQNPVPQQTPEPQQNPELQQNPEPQIIRKPEPIKSKKGKVIDPKVISKKPKVKSKKPKVESVKSTYDFKKLVLHFDNPELVENAKLNSRRESDSRNSQIGAGPSDSSNQSDSLTSQYSNGSEQPQTTANNKTFPTGADKEPGYVSKKPTRSATFTVPYKKPPRGKCTNWENCPNCSLLVDCGQCRNCVDKSLK